MAPRTDYVICTDIAFSPGVVMDVGELGRACVHEWFNQSLCLVNDSVIRMGVFRGEFHWHHHEREDEFFFVLEGCLLVDFRDRTVALQRHQGIVVPHCVEHRTRAEMRTVVLMVEPATIVPVGQSTAPPHA